MADNPINLTEKQKLMALQERFYLTTENPWQPKKGDYYTTSRGDLELYQITDEDEEYYYTVYCDTSKYFAGVIVSRWPKAEFLTGFGLNRLQVKPHIFQLV